MVKIGYHASHEQFKPSDLLRFVQMAEQAGFQLALSSDHFTPWSERQAQSGFAWSWLGAAMQATPKLAYRVVNAPGQRYHPAIIAQAAATLAEMFPERFWITVGSGQLMNEYITGDKWIPKDDRNTRLKECVDIMRALWRGERVTHRGFVTVEEAKLYSRPEIAPKVIGAAITPKTAAWLAGWADGLITISQPKEKLQQVIEAFRSNGGEGKPMLLKVQLSYARDEQTARNQAHDQWRNNIFDSKVLTELKTPDQFDAMGELVQPDELDPFVRISADLQQQIDWLQQDVELGFDELLLHNVNLQQEEFIEDFGRVVIPALTQVISPGEISDRPFTFIR
ncbi:TIGR03885 family FMN-dependent LLM class oxidoreductase [Leptolyngbya sp. FACHB-711]|uniref:TIGR03885 family FMN-dependent LLM class oxidoreductase n=1 Tax=unclassified Leptolyngbya TaxID=2650499 RepID=UPI0016877FD8|nr:TIGR03885 family FMN-dependent LLM class oxidoreductase [Leptolyngbya sp. FACHB-711]MBD1849984.1 TIGR03885 family FMN-dependent LLM class oxidoreductase [Cyanobacteria bacterium FACHB-502]MBD2027479.1 TIGR03885 family FMN-dependent LLM class oxidoreductase [Leptolyngbya sp. FACHB-711]